jgi:hypothetical protein
MLASDVDRNCTYVNPVLVTGLWVRSDISQLSTRVPIISNVVSFRQRGPLKLVWARFEINFTHHRSKLLLANIKGRPF